MIRVADPDYNADRVIESARAACDKGVKVLVFYTEVDGKRVINDLEIIQ